MTNRHFGKLSGVWKHAAFAGVLEREQPDAPGQGPGP